MNEHIIHTIKLLSTTRQELYNKYESTYDSSTGKYEMVWPEEIDDLMNKIYKLLESFHHELPIELVIEELTKIGDAPCILYDDSGNFAICSTGCQNVSGDNEPCNMNISHFILKKQWKPTIREALKFYFDESTESYEL